MKKIINLFVFLSVLFITLYAYCANEIDKNSIEYQQKLEEARELRESVGFVTTNTTSLNNSDNRIVYITNDSAKFHSAGCSEMKSAPHVITVSSAQNKGYGACEVCNPYNLANTKTEKNNNLPIIISIVVVLLLLIIYIIFNEKRYKKQP